MPITKDRHPSRRFFLLLFLAFLPACSKPSTVNCFVEKKLIYSGPGDTVIWDGGCTVTAGTTTFRCTSCTLSDYPN